MLKRTSPIDFTGWKWTLTKFCIETQDTEIFQWLWQFLRKILIWLILLWTNHTSGGSLFYVWSSRKNVFLSRGEQRWIKGVWIKMAILPCPSPMLQATDLLMSQASEQQTHAYSLLLLKDHFYNQRFTLGWSTVHTNHSLLGCVIEFEPLSLLSVYIMQTATAFNTTWKTILCRFEES